MRARHVTIGLVVLVLLAVVLRVGVPSSLAAPSAPPAFAGVVPFTTVGGLMGFFDSRDGKVYLYDGNLDKCVMVKQVQRLGQPLKKLTR
jgi:hypothetical protein